MKLMRSAFLALGFLLAVSAAQAQDARVKANIPFDFVVGDRAAITGGSVVATVADGSAGFYNQAGLAQVESQRFKGILSDIAEKVNQGSSLADQLQETTARVMVLRVGLEVLREVVDALAEKRDLNFRGPGVAVVGLVIADDAALAVLVQRH